MKKIKIQQILNPVTYISAGINAGRRIKRWPTFLSCLVLVAALWGLGLLYAFQDVEAWKETARWEIVMVMCNILIITTIFSLFPAAVYAAFSLRERKRAMQQTLSELSHYNMRTQLEGEVKECFNTAYDAESYRVPVPLATYAMLLGWALFFFSSGSEVIPRLAESGSITIFLDGLGNSHPIVFGFLGAFFFSLQTLFHRFVTLDLKASVFMHIAVRIWVVLVLTLVLAAIWSVLEAPENNGYPPSLLATSFIVGIFPDVAFNLIKTAAKKISVGIKITTEPHIPLNEIQGLNIWQQARLDEEGINSVQNLAMVDIVSLMVNTRLGLMRILHWIDQAILVVHIDKGDLKKFRKAGIRTATDLKSIYISRLPPRERKKLECCRKEERASDIGRVETSYIPAVPQGLISSLGGDEGLKERVRNIMIAICEDENYQRLWNIRRGQLQKEDETKDHSSVSN